MLTTKEIIDSGFFKAFLIENAECNHLYNDFNDDRLIYAMCDSEEEKLSATHDEIAKIKKSIRKIEHTELSLHIFSKYHKDYPVDFSKEENDDYYWLEYIHEYIINYISEYNVTFNPITLVNERIEELNYEVEFERENLDEETLKAIDIFESYSIDDWYIKLDEEIELMKLVSNDIDSFKEKNYWNINIYYYEDYIEDNFTIELLFKLSDLMILINRLKTFQLYLKRPLNDDFSDPLQSSLEKYHFFDLPLVSKLTPDNQNKLVDLIMRNKIPYIIALLDYLGFIDHLQRNHFTIKYKLHRAIARMLGSNERTVKGNINSLNPYTTENQERYTAFFHKEIIEKDYQKL
jgi:hypothetical protein